jgi:LysR family glycine cleavage system transcriptional activator
MGRNSINLNAIRAFEAVARHLSFTRAAQELNVTQAAVSHQVKSLEQRLGVTLFLRHNRGLLLTKEGQAMLQPLSNAFDLIDDATNLLTNRAVEIIKVSMPCSFASMWLVPRLNSFYTRYPDIDVRIMITSKSEDMLKAGEVDIDLRYGDGKWSQVNAQKFLNEEIFPVCSPAMLKGKQPLRNPEDLTRFTLIHDSRDFGWKAWLDHTGIKGVDHSRGPGFSHYHHTIQSALLGDGIAMGRSPLVADALARGDLVRPFPASLPTGMGYYIVTAGPVSDKTRIPLFSNWLLEATENFELVQQQE